MLVRPECVMAAWMSLYRGVCARLGGCVLARALQKVLERVELVPRDEFSNLE